MTKSDLYHNLVVLGRAYRNGLIFPDTRHATKANLANRCTWMQRALELKDSNSDLAYNLFWAAWISGCIETSVAQKAGLS